MFFDTFELKGVCHEIFELHLFQDSNPSVHLINRLKYFLIRFRFCRDILIFKKHHVCIIPRSSVADQYHFDTDPDPGCEKIYGSGSRVNFDMDPDPDPGKNDTDPDPEKNPKYQENL